MRTVLVMAELVGYLGIVWGLYLLIATSPSSAGGEDSTPDEDPRPHAAGGLPSLEGMHAVTPAERDALLEQWRAAAHEDMLKRLESSSVLDRLDRLDDEAGR